MLTIRDILARVDRSNPDNWVDVEEVAHALGIDLSYDSTGRFQERVKAHWVLNWCCTDEWVGMQVYDLDGEPFAISMKTARKNRTDFEFVSEEMIAKVRAFLVELMVVDTKPQMLKLDAEFPETHTVAYGAQLLVKEGLYEGQPCAVVKTWQDYKDIDRWHDILVRLPDGEEKVIQTSEFDIPIRIKEAQ